MTQYKNVRLQTTKQTCSESTYSGTMCGGVAAPLVSGFRTSIFRCLGPRFLFLSQICWKLESSSIESILKRLGHKKSQFSWNRAILAYFPSPELFRIANLRYESQWVAWGCCWASVSFSGENIVTGLAAFWRGASQLHVGSKILKKDL